MAHIHAVACMRLPWLRFSQVVEFNLASTAVALQKDDTHCKLTVFRSGDVNCHTSVTYVCSFEPRSPQVIQFKPMQTAASIQISLLDGDKSVAPGEDTVAFTVALVGTSAGTRIGSKATCAMQAATVTESGVLTLASDDLRVAEGKRCTLTLRRVGGAEGEVTCRIDTKDGTAVAPLDYAAIEGLVVTFAEGETEKVVTVDLIEDVCAVLDSCRPHESWLVAPRSPIPMIAYGAPHTRTLAE